MKQRERKYTKYTKIYKQNSQKTHLKKQPASIKSQAIKLVFLRDLKADADINILIGHFLRRMRDYMLPAHRRLIQEISRGPSLRAFVQSQGPGDSRLSGAFTRCVAGLVALRSHHINMVSRYISVPAGRARQLRAQGHGTGEMEALGRAPAALEEVGTGGSGIMSFLKTVRDRTGDASLPGGGGEARQEQLDS